MMRFFLWIPVVFFPASFSAQEKTTPLEPLIRLLAESKDKDLQLDVLRGLHEAMRGRRNVTPPPGWTKARAILAASDQEEVRENALHLAAIFGEPAALEQLRGMVLNAKSATASRQRALQALGQLQDSKLRPLLEDLVDDSNLRGQALRALGGFGDPAVASLILAKYPKLNGTEKSEAVAVLTTRPTFALALLKAIEAKDIPRSDLTAFNVRQLASLKDAQVSKRLTEVWGILRPTSKDKTALLIKYQSVAPPDALKKADRSQGRVTFNKICANCHKLFGEGGAIAPELTGSQRTNPEYLLTKILDPSAVVSKDFQVTIIEMKDGRVLSGVVKEETPQTFALQTPMELLRLATKDVAARKLTGQSLMPEGLLTSLSDREVRDLIAYLAGAEQVGLPK
jgi:putative heme-binding domain-containing protein